MRRKTCHISPQQDATLISDLLRADRARTPSLGASNPLPPTLWIPFVAPRLVSPDEVPALSARSGVLTVSHTLLPVSIRLLVSLSPCQGLTFSGVLPRSFFCRCAAQARSARVAMVHCRGVW